MGKEDNELAARARNLKASRFLYRVDVVARVESEDDISFWHKAIRCVRPGVKVKFIPAEVSESKERQRGKTLCMKLVEYLDEHLLICVDSDFDKFLHPEWLMPSKHILQTHTYSWENHYCQGCNLQEAWRRLECGTFDFASFLTRFSRIVYPALVGMLTAKSLGVKSWSLDSLCGEILNVHTNQKTMLEEDGRLLLQAIVARVDAWTKRQKPLDTESIGRMGRTAVGIGLTSDNAYLYMQGHCVYDLVLRVGNALAQPSHDFKYEVLSPAFSCDGYHEIEMVKSDIAQLL